MVRLVHVDGCFDRGHTRQNRAEAEAVVGELARRAHDPACSGRSVGVVTFNIQQQNLISDLLDEACANDEVLEKWAFHAEEPLFIKNLENVQGDERDVILFSIGYGPDAGGRVTMNFGPLNREGGWRRLNVAVSRARCEMVVYATLRPEQIDLSRTSARGVAALRSFLAYAQAARCRKTPPPPGTPTSTRAAWPATSAPGCKNTATGRAPWSGTPSTAWTLASSTPASRGATCWASPSMATPTAKRAPRATASWRSPPYSKG